MRAAAEPAAPVPPRPVYPELTDNPFPAENICGHLSRVLWMAEQLSSDDRIVEIGCGTGYRVTLPLAKWGYRVVGIDRDAASVDYGRRVMAAAGVPIDTVRPGDLEAVQFPPTAVILSEVLEHVPDDELPALLAAVGEALVPGGTVLVTVPNGYGYFELESFVFFRLGLGRLLSLVGFTKLWPIVKTILYRGETRNRVPSSFSTAPHVQRFTFRSIQELLAQSGFQVKSATGSVLLCGPLCDLLFTGSETLQRWNVRLGRRFPAVASGFYVVASKPA